MSKSDKSLTTLILSLEQALLRDDVRQSPAQIESLLSGDFFEFGSSGAIYRFSSGDTFPPVAEYLITDFDVKILSPDCVLATYRITMGQGDKVKHSLRSTIWKLFDGEWKAIFHQGTIV